jgi:sigma-B regulation protein RsbU (phosphoserine phosphatase)
VPRSRTITLLLLFGFCGAMRAAPVALRGWELAVTVPRAMPPGNDVRWSRGVEERRERDLWFRHRLPDVLPRDARLVFRAYMPHFALFAGQQRVYAFDDDGVRDRMAIHVVALPQNAAGAFLFIRVIHPEGDPYLGDAPLLAAQADLPAAMHHVAIAPLREDFADISTGAILFVLGLTAIAISQLIRRRDTRTLLYFGLFSGLYGARILANSHLPYALGLRARDAMFATAWITYIINIPGWALARGLIGDGWKSTLRWQIYLFGLFAPVGIASDLLTGHAGSLETANNVLVILGAITVFANLLRAKPWKSIELRVILIGTLIFISAALSNNLSSLGVLPLAQVDETLGFIAFLLALGYAAMRSFVRSERARTSLENELATAREIQRSILPTSMPDVGGLRFDAYYDPASSVAGDLYDFLAVDAQRTGALVADVSGHGVPAALIASMMKIAVSSQSPLAHDPAALLREVNRTLRGQVRRVFVTATYLFFDMERRAVDVANAGHPAPLLHRGTEIRELGPQGVVLGRFEATYAAEIIALQRGDRIVAYTDGVTEALNARGEAFGEERLHAMIRDGASAEDMALAVRAWRHETSEADDVTLLVVDVA